METWAAGRGKENNWYFSGVHKTCGIGTRELKNLLSFLSWILLFNPLWVLLLALTWPCQSGTSWAGKYEKKTNVISLPETCTFYFGPRGQDSLSMHKRCTGVHMHTLTSHTCPLRQWTRGVGGSAGAPLQALAGECLQQSAAAIGLCGISLWGTSPGQ